MGMKFSSFFKSRGNITQNEPEERLFLKKNFNDFSITLTSWTIHDIPEDEVQHIMDIICNELKNEIDGIGYRIAKRIVTENHSGFCAARVDGGEDGKHWLVELATDPLYFH